MDDLVHRDTRHARSRRSESLALQHDTAFARHRDADRPHGSATRRRVDELRGGAREFDDVVARQAVAEKLDEGGKRAGDLGLDLAALAGERVGGLEAEARVRARRDAGDETGGEGRDDERGGARAAVR